MVELVTVVQLGIMFGMLVEVVLVVVAEVMVVKVWTWR